MLELIAAFVAIVVGLCFGAVLLLLIAELFLTVVTVFLIPITLVIGLGAAAVAFIWEAVANAWWRFKYNGR